MAKNKRTGKQGTCTRQAKASVSLRKASHSKRAGAPRQLLTTEEVARVIGCSRFTVGRVLRADPGLAMVVGARYVVEPSMVSTIRARIPRAGKA